MNTITIKDYKHVTFRKHHPAVQTIKDIVFVSACAWVVFWSFCLITSVLNK